MGIAWDSRAGIIGDFALRGSLVPQPEAPYTKPGHTLRSGSLVPTEVGPVVVALGRVSVCFLFSFLFVFESVLSTLGQNPCSFPGQNFGSELSLSLSSP